MKTLFIILAIVRIGMSVEQVVSSDCSNPLVDDSVVTCINFY